MRLYDERGEKWMKQDCLRRRPLTSHDRPIPLAKLRPII